MSSYYALLPWLACALLAVLANSASFASAAIVRHSFTVQNLKVNRLCSDQVITTVNGQFPGPTITVREGDNLIVNVINQSPYNITIHWHGVSGLNPWADGPSMITQCPIRPGYNYTYNFSITKHEGTLFWHAHNAWFRNTVFGLIVIKPRLGHSTPYPRPFREVPIILGEWWNASVLDVEQTTVNSGGTPQANDAFFINGLPGDLYDCSQNQMFRFNVKKGKTYLLRILNAGINNNMFFKIANHSMTVVGIDGSYTKPYVTDVIMIALGQTTDVLLTANQPLGSYYMAATHYDLVGEPGEDTFTRGLIVYDGASSSMTPVDPVLPFHNDTSTVFKFQSSLSSLVGGPHFLPVPRLVDEHMFITVGLGIVPCDLNATCSGPFGQRMAASMNNVSFEAPTKLSLLEAFYYNVSGIYTVDFPDNPPVQFDYISGSISLNRSLIATKKSTSVKRLKFNSTVEIVFQDTALLSKGANHPMHLHGFSFHILAQDFGNYDPVSDRQKFNLVNPPLRNTLFVPKGGWIAIRFTANKPGVWLMHCHMDVHVSWGMETAFLVENGPTPSDMLAPPPLDRPQC
ncbi:laccase-7-like [Tripterygium wilfordii]|uniref:laccase-7-like n=1 Tax=Tripterygium wilfordii TaxID=458696 RepID=UPI0018F83BA8|nr:laccase-7-like [Tripterygium wilfordii]